MKRSELIKALQDSDYAFLDSGYKNEYGVPNTVEFVKADNTVYIYDTNQGKYAEIISGMVTMTVNLENIKLTQASCLYITVADSTIIFCL